MKVRTAVAAFATSMSISIWQASRSVIHWGLRKAWRFHHKIPYSLQKDSQESGSDDDCSIHDVGGSNRQVQPDIPSAAPIKRPPPSDISSMGKMIVTISGNSEKKEASVSSGKLLIEVRDDRSLRSQVENECTNDLNEQEIIQLENVSLGQAVNW